MLNQLIGRLTGQHTTHELHNLMKAYTEQRKFCGAVLVAKGNEILLREGHGLANVEHNILNKPETVFRIGSMTKPFTAILIMQLVEEGKLKLQDRLNQYLPDYPNGECITVHHLLSNTSGIPDYIVMEGYEKIMKQRVSLPELFKLFCDEALIFEPGSDFGYSNSNWVMLGYIIEQLTNKPYVDVLHERIFKPSGMTHSGVDWERPIIPHRATGYIDRGTDLMNAELIDDTTMHGAGAIYSTIDDLYRWDRALHSDVLLPQEVLRQMWMPVSQNDGGQYGYGWEIRRLFDRQVIGHSGGLPGYVSDIARFVDEDLVVIMLSNLGSTAHGDIMRDLSAIVLDKPYEFPEKRTFVAVDPAIFSEYVGRYELTYFGRKSILNFSIEGQNMVMKVQGLPKATLNAMSTTTFFARSKGEVELTFVRDEAGHVNTIEVIWDQHPLKAVRLESK
jgi:CubicO group peptidase (beta-lactamase class C family)